MLVFSLFLGPVAANASSPVPYSLFVLAGLVPWTFFSNAIASAGQSVVGSQNLVTKVYFPRLIVPMGAVGAGLVDFAIAFGLLVVMVVWQGVAPGWSSSLIPLLTLGLVMAALGVGTILSALTVAYRDFRHIVPFLVQFWMFATPSIYLQAGSSTDSRLSYVLPLNPAYGLIANFRQSLLGVRSIGTRWPSPEASGCSCSWSAACISAASNANSRTSSENRDGDSWRTPMDMDRIKIGIVGCGYWGPNLIRNFSSCPQTEVVAVCDASPARLEAIRRNFPHLLRVESLHKLLDLRLDAVAIATPVSTHCPLAERCLNAGLHVLVEKPLASTVAEARALLELAARCCRVLMVDHTYLFSSAVRRIKAIARLRRAGRALLRG